MVAMFRFVRSSEGYNDPSVGTRADGIQVHDGEDFLGLAWVRYDTAFRRQAALTGNTRWSVINSTLYTMCFTGQATNMKRCELCFAISHTEGECAQSGDPDPGGEGPPKNN